MDAVARRAHSVGEPTHPTEQAPLWLDYRWEDGGQVLGNIWMEART